VLDTNVLVRNFHSANPASPNKRIYRLWWQERQLQLIVSPEVIEEYLPTLVEVVDMEPAAAEVWRIRFESDNRCTVVNLARQYSESRDPDDNIFLATATAGEADYLITNDRDLLELPDEFQRKLPFTIRTPRQFLQEWDKS
jgi:putative PIN family toxin of toxin-antitoxin system